MVPHKQKFWKFDHSVNAIPVESHAGWKAAAWLFSTDSQLSSR
jgi:hypothetical protein